MTRSKISKVLVVLLVIIVMTSLLSACNWFDKATKITKVDITMNTDLSQQDGVYQIGAGEQVSMTVDWHHIMIDKPTLRWYVSINGGDKQEIEGEKDKNLRYTVGEIGTSYEFFASANSVDSQNSIKVLVVSGVKDVIIAIASGLGEPNGAGAYEVESGNSFSLTANWTETTIGGKQIEWYVATNGGESTITSQTSKTSTWSAISVGTTYIISAKVNGVSSSNSITVIVIEGSTPISIVFNVVLNGITDSDSNGYAEARYGDSFDVRADFGGLLISDPTIDWFLDKDGVEEKLLDTDSSVTYTISSREIEHYEFRAVYKGEEDVPGANKAKVEFIDFTLSQPVLSSSSHSIIDNSIQHNINDVGAPDIALAVDWNKSELPKEIVTISWYVDDVVQVGKTNETFTFDVSSVSVACEKTVKVKIDYKAQSVNATIDLSFVEEYLPISNVTLSVNQTATVVKAYDLSTTYKVTTATTSNPGTVTVSAIANPEGTDLSADCVWTIRDMSGTRVLASKERSVDVPLAYGKNVITATIQNMKSRSVIVYALTASDLSDRAFAIQTTFVWDGSVQDQYINNQEELNLFVGYLVSTHEIADDQYDTEVRQVYLAPNEWRDGVNTTTQFATDFHTALEQGVDESGSPSIMHLGHQKFWLSTSSNLGNPSGAFTPATPIEQRNVYVNYEELSDKRTKIPADDFTETLLVKNSNQLTHALTWGYKPVFENNAEGTRLSTLYNKAKAMLLDYISASMTELEKVQIIYNWLAKEIDYDYATAAYEGSDGINFNAFYLEGVFDDYRAVCDGKSKAFSLLCGMEGIRSMRIIGTANGGGHAWNKVLVDVDGDGAREWFFIDSTWGDNKLTINEEAKETLTYEYFLKTDAAMSGTHESDMEQPVCNTEYDCYEGLYVKVSSTKTVCQYITDIQQLKDLRDYSTLNGNIMIQVKLSSAMEALLPTVVNLGRVSLGNRVYYIYGA